MNARRRRPVHTRSLARKGFTLIELLVVISIIATLIALVTPAVQSARAAARKVQCLNNVKNLAVAVVNYQSNNGDKIPYLVSGTGGLSGQGQYSWGVQLLPLLDSAALARQIRDDTTGNVAAAGWVPNLSLRFFTCPDDQNNFRIDGGLSYAANVGYINGGNWGVVENATNGYHTVGGITPHVTSGASNEIIRTVHLSSGVFWRPYLSDFTTKAPRMTGDFIQRGDGLQYTLLFAENMQSRNWASRQMNDIGFGIGVNMSSNSPSRTAGTSGQIGYTSGSADTTTALYVPPDYQLVNGTATGSPSSAPNWNPTAAPGTTPRPSSQHTGGIVNVAFCDGRAQNLNESVSGEVFAKLLTPDGGRYGQAVINPNDIE